MVLVDPKCLDCSFGWQKCMEKAQRGKKRKLRRLYPGHVWTLKWCPRSGEGPMITGLARAFSKNK